MGEGYRFTIGVGSNFMMVMPRSRKGVGQDVRVAHGDLGGSGARQTLKIRPSERDSEAFKGPLRSLLCRNPTVLLGNEFERKFT